MLIRTSFGLLLALSLAIQGPSQRPVVTRHVASEQARDPRFESALVRVLSESIPVRGASIEYYYNRVDLDDDGKPEVMAFIFGKDMCGTSGCSLMIFRTRAADYELVTDIAVVRNPVIVSEHKTNGWRDLIVFVAGGGIRPGYYGVLAYDGHTYPPNGTDAEPLTHSMRGTAYLVGSPSPGSGIPLDGAR